LTHRLAGTVVVDGAPRDGSYVRVTGPSGDFVWEARTDEDGGFSFWLPPGTWTLLGFAPGTGQERQQVELSGDREDLMIELKSS
jgi:hypothetical protein